MELVPIMRAAGWKPAKASASRKYTYWWGRFCFERASQWRVEFVDIGYKYGWRARVRTIYVLLTGDEDEKHEEHQGGFDGRWCWPATLPLSWLAYRLFKPAPDLIRFAIDDAKQQLVALDRFSATGEWSERKDFYMEFRTASRAWFEDERDLLDAAIAAQEK